MALAAFSEPIPIQTDKDGVFRIGSTRVTLDTVVAAFSEGATAEEIVQQYPSLQLADVYSVLGYYLHQHNEIEDYLRRQHDRAHQVQRQNLARFDPEGVRDRLLARRKNQQA